MPDDKKQELTAAFEGFQRDIRALETKFAENVNRLIKEKEQEKLAAIKKDLGLPA